MGAPWFKFFPKAYLADSKVRMLPREMRSMLVDLWCYCSEDGGIPADTESIALLLGEPIDTTTRAMERLRVFFIVEDGRLVSTRMRDEASAYQEKCEKLRANASKGGKQTHAKDQASAQANAKAKTQADNRAKSTEAEAEAEREKDIKEPASSPAAAVPLAIKSGKPKKEKKPPKVRTTALKPESVKAFEACWAAYPETFRKWVQGVQDFVDEPVAKGSKFQGELAFQALVDAGVATPKVLYCAIFAYLTEGIMPKRGFFQAVSTFFGPEKATYLEWLERGRELAQVPA